MGTRLLRLGVVDAVDKERKKKKRLGCSVVEDLKSEIGSSV